MKPEQRLIILSLGLVSFIFLMSSAKAVDEPTLSDVTVALLYDSSSDTQTAEDFRQALIKEGWKATALPSEPAPDGDKARLVQEFRAERPEFEIVVEGYFGREDRLSLNVYWEEDATEPLPAVRGQPFDAVLAEFVEFIDSWKVQDYVFERRKHQTRGEFEVQLAEAWEKYRNSNWLEAKRQVEAILDEPEVRKEWEPYFLLAHCHKKLEEEEEALDYFEKVRQLDQNNSGAILELGNLEFDQGEFSKAKDWYMEAVGRGTSNLHRARWNLALSHQILQEWDDAKKNYQMLLAQPSYSRKARARIREIDEKLSEFKRLQDEESLEAEKRAAFFRWLRGGLAIGAIAFATAWVVLLQRQRNLDKSIPSEKKGDLTTLVTQALVGLWCGLLSSFATTFLG
jgi:tetratricopeptide (TPR) repeat protein